MVGTWMWAKAWEEVRHSMIATRRAAAECRRLQWSCHIQGVSRRACSSSGCTSPGDQFHCRNWVDSPCSSFGSRGSHQWWLSGTLAAAPSDSAPSAQTEDLIFKIEFHIHLLIGALNHTNPMNSFESLSSSNNWSRFSSNWFPDKTGFN